jgi:hypothetical protein
MSGVTEDPGRVCENEVVEAGGVEPIGNVAESQPTDLFGSYTG